MKLLMNKIDGIIHFITKFIFWVNMYAKYMNFFNFKKHHIVRKDTDNYDSIDLYVTNTLLHVIRF